MQENLITVKEERLFLLRKLCQQQGEADQPAVIARTQQNNVPLPIYNVDGVVTPKKSVKKRNSVDISSSGETSKLYLLLRLFKNNDKLFLFNR